MTTTWTTIASNSVSQSLADQVASSIGEAAQSATDAEVAQAAAEASATAAAASATSAATSVSGISASVAAAATSETNAAASATAAAASAADAAAAGYDPTSVAITGGSIAGITDLAVADGGTGASSASAARSNLGLGTMATEASADYLPLAGGTMTGLVELQATRSPVTALGSLGAGTSSFTETTPLEQTLTLTGDRTIDFAAATSGKSYIKVLRITQDVTGGRNVTWNFASGTANIYHIGGEVDFSAQAANVISVVAIRVIDGDMEIRVDENITEV